jgi:flagellum-specific peptidoglycan hydrolase FlgJ
MVNYLIEKINNMKTTFKILAVLGIYLFSLNIISLSRKEAKNEAVYAGRTDKNTKETTYNLSGLPTSRKWLTQLEWKGKHIKCTDYVTKARFKAWKKIHIETFIKFFGQAAQEEVKLYPKLKASVIVAQAILESNFGLSRLAVTGNNLFGHKYRGKTDNFIIAADDSPNDKFEGGFKSQWHSLRSHTKLLLKRYAPRIKGEASVEAWIGALCGGRNVKQSKKYRKKGGYVYATSCLNSCYQCKLRRIIKFYNLEKFD